MNSSEVHSGWRCLLNRIEFLCRLRGDHELRLLGTTRCGGTQFPHEHIHPVCLSVPSCHYFKGSIRDFAHVVGKERQKEMVSHILMGIPFYGYDGMDAITGPTLIDDLKRYTVEIRYLKEKEHVIR